MSRPTQEDIDELLLSCRYGELGEAKAYTEQYGWGSVISARDDRGNTVLHMCCGNGHAEILQFLLPHLPRDLLQTTNEAGSPPLHWAILNNHISIVKILSELPESQGGGLPLLHQKNRLGRDAFAESLFAGEGKEEVAGYIEGFLFKAEGGAGEEGEEASTKEEGGDVKMTINQSGELKVEEIKQGDEGAESEAVKELEEKAASVTIGQ